MHLCPERMSSETCVHGRLAESPEQLCSYTVPDLWAISDGHWCRVRVRPRRVTMLFFILECSVPGLSFFCADSWLLILLFIRHVLRLTAHDSSIAAAAGSADWELKTLSLLTASLEALHPCALALHGGSQKQGYRWGRSQNCVKVGHHLRYVCCLPESNPVSKTTFLHIPNSETWSS
jgi:hypothetical protein